MRVLNLFGSVLLLIALAACSNDEQQEQPSYATDQEVLTKDGGADANLRDGSPSILIAANSKTQICENMIKGERIQYRVDFSDKLHFGVSAGQEMNSNAPVAVHITRSEVRAFTVKISGDHCFHFDNQQAHGIEVTLSHKRL